MVATVAGIHLGPDTHANRPAGNAVPDGSLYVCTTHGLIYRSNYAGNTWATWATLGGGAPAAHAASHQNGGSDEIDVTGLTGAGGGGGSITYQTVALSADVPVVTNNAFVDGPSIGSLAAGTYFCSGTVQMSSGGIGTVTAKLWDGTTAVDSGSVVNEGNSLSESFHLSGIIVLAGTGTIKISGTFDNLGTSHIRKTTPSPGTGDIASRLTVLKIA